MANEIKVPVHIDEPPIFIFWSQDEFIPLTVVMGIGLHFHYFFTALILQYFVLRAYKKVKDGNLRGYFLHWMWQKGFFQPDGVRSFISALTKEITP